MKKKVLLKKAVHSLSAICCILGISILIFHKVYAGDSDFVVNEKGVLKKYTGAGGDVMIPSEVNGIKVTTVGDLSFFDCDSLKSIVIPEGITTIEAEAFWGCSNLSSITISEGVTSIGSGAFAGCSVAAVAIPKSVNSISFAAFSDCPNLESAYFYNADIEIIDERIVGELPLFGVGNTLVTIYGYKDSSAEAHAKKYNYKFQVMNESDKFLTGISLKKAKIDIAVGKSSLNGVIYHPEDTTEDKTVKWTSSNPSVAYVYSNGKVKGLTPGTAVITAQVGKYSADCIVTVH